MIFTFQLSYFECQNCQSRVHCKDCSAKVGEILARYENVTVLEADLERKSLRLEMEEAVEEDVVDLLEQRGFFAD